MDGRQGAEAMFRLKRGGIALIAACIYDRMTPEQLKALDGLLSKREKRIFDTLRYSKDVEELGRIARACHNEPETPLGKAVRSLQNKVMGVLEWDGFPIVVD